MSDTKKKKYEKFITPAGIAKFPRLNKPETEVNGSPCAPRFKVTLILDEKEKGVPEFLKKIQALHDAAIAKAEAKKKADPKRKNKPLKINETVRALLDDEGNQVEGKYEIVAKTAAETKEGTPKTVKMFDAKGKPVKANVGGGSTLKLSVVTEDYDSNLGAGLSIYLNAVQIIDLVEFGGGSAKSYGFGEEEGFSGEDTEETPEDAPEFASEGGGESAEESSAPRAKGDF